MTARHVGLRLLASAGIVVSALVGGIAGCGGSSSGGPPTTLPGDLVPASAATATVTVTVGGATTSVPADTVGKAVPFLVRRVFEAKEPLASYGLDPPAGTITFAMADGTTVVLSIGAEEFDASARYLQRAGDARVWVVLDESLDPLLAGRLTTAS